MIKGTEILLREYNELFENRVKEIRNAKDNTHITGTKYYVSADGDDNNDGKSESTPWKSLRKVSCAKFQYGDGVLFRRGDVFRGYVPNTSDGVTYGAYGSGDKPILCAGDKDYADKSLWTLYDKDNSIWKCTEKTLDVGTIVFDGGEKHARKLFPTYNEKGQFVCRDDESRIFMVENELTQDLDLYWHFDDVLTTFPDKEGCFPVPAVNDAYGDLYLRCDKGNPGEVFQSVELVARRHMFYVGRCRDVKFDNLCIKYVGMHGIAGAWDVKGLCVTNCEFGWIGGTIHQYYGNDPNFPQGHRGQVGRFGNAVEVYGGCEDYTVSGCYIYQVFDAGITHQFTTSEKTVMKNVKYQDKVIEKCVYGIEYFLEVLDGGEESVMENIDMSRNFIRLGGYGWGQQRHNVHTPALIKGWSFENTARNYTVTENIFDRCAYRLLHLVAKEKESCPVMNGNTYIQNYGGKIGQYGYNKYEEPENMTFDDDAENKILEILGDKNAKVIVIE